jgi:hypothetical protein
LVKAKRLFLEGDHRKAKKNIVHGLRYFLTAMISNLPIRYMNYAKQLAETGAIFDLTSGNEYFHKVIRLI